MTLSLTLSDRSAGASHAIAGELVIQTVDEARQMLLPILAETPCIDLSGISAIDTAGLQLVLMAGRAGIGFCHPSPEVEALLRFARLDLPTLAMDMDEKDAS